MAIVSMSSYLKVDVMVALRAALPLANVQGRDCTGLLPSDGDEPNAPQSPTFGRL